MHANTEVTVQLSVSWSQYCTQHHYGPYHACHPRIIDHW